MPRSNTTIQHFVVPPSQFGKIKKREINTENNE